MNFLAQNKTWCTYNFSFYIVKTEMKAVEEEEKVKDDRCLQIFEYISNFTF